MLFIQHSKARNRGWLTLYFCHFLLRSTSICKVTQVEFKVQKKLEIGKENEIQGFEVGKQKFKQWFETHKGLIFRVIRAYTVSVEDQDDLFQEILLQLWSSIDNFQGNAKETTWIYRIALNTALIWRRRETRKRKKHCALILEFNETSCTQCDNDQPYDPQVLEQLYQAIRQLSVMDSSVIVMHLDGVSYDEMAEVLGISKNHVGVRLNRAKGRLAKFMKGSVNDI